MPPRSLTDLVARCHEVAEPGTDPVVVAHLVAWTVRPRRTLDALRRRCRDDGAATIGGGASDDASGPARLLAQLAAAQLDPDDLCAAARVVEAWAQLDCRVAVVGDPAYPALLAQGWPQIDAPCLLVRRGQPLAPRPTVAMVGARRASAYGTGVTSWLAEAAADAGALVISGGALGIDAAAHRAAAPRVGGTVVVLGCGHRVTYPRPHARPGGLFDEVMDHAGALLSELLPDEPPRAGMVRARNRIVAGMADVVVVVEGGARSGALLTAGAAAERGRTVLAVPGDVRAPGSAAPHRLLQEGAAPCTDPVDLLDALQASTSSRDGAIPPPTLGFAPLAAGRASSDTLSVLGPDLYAVLARAWPRPVRVDDLAAASGRPTGAVLAALTRARVAGELAEDASGVRLRRAPATSGES